MGPIASRPQPSGPRVQSAIQRFSMQVFSPVGQSSFELHSTVQKARSAICRHSVAPFWQSAAPSQVPPKSEGGKPLHEPPNGAHCFVVSEISKQPAPRGQSSDVSQGAPQNLSLVFWLVRQRPPISQSVSELQFAHRLPGTKVSVSEGSPWSFCGMASIVLTSATATSDEKPESAMNSLLGGTMKGEGSDSDAESQPQINTIQILPHK